MLARNIFRSIRCVQGPLKYRVKLNRALMMADDRQKEGVDDIHELTIQEIIMSEKNRVVQKVPEPNFLERIIGHYQPVKPRGPIYNRIQN